jgi:hypothetical protein
MDNQHKLITGYRDLTAGDIALINKVKQCGVCLDEIIAELRQMQSADHRWVSIGATQLQQGIMALVRAVAKPDGF